MTNEPLEPGEIERMVGNRGHVETRVSPSPQSTSGETLPSQSNRPHAASQSSVPPGTSFAGGSSRRDGSTLGELDAIVDRCRNGQSSRSETTAKVLESLERVTTLTPAAREKAFVSYLAEIVAIERETDRSNLPPEPGLPSRTAIPDQTRKTSPALDAYVFPSQTSHGSEFDEGVPILTETLAAPESANSSKPTEKTSNEVSSSLERPQTSPKEFRSPNGSGSSEVKCLILTTSYLQSSALLSMRKSRLALERHSSLSAHQKLSERSNRQVTGRQHGGELQTHLPSLSPTGETNLTCITPISSASSMQSSQPLASASSPTTSPCETTLEVVKPSSSLIGRISPTFTQQLSSPMELSSAPIPSRGLFKPEPRLPPTPAGNTTRLEAVPTARVDISTHVVNAEKRGTHVPSVQTGRNEAGLQPKYLRYNLWGADQENPMTIVDWSEIAKPLPRPPISEINNPIVASTLASHPNLFAIGTPIRVDHFELLLADHPNRPFVTSIISGLREGFWPWANTLNPGFPSTHSQEPNGHYDDAHKVFFRTQLAHEQSCGRYSDSLGESLLPGMYSMPIYAVPKPDSNDFHLVNDHSAGPFLVNSMIDHSQVTGYPLDNLHQLGTMLLNQRDLLLGLDQVMWKSDIVEAYRMCPIHPLWQLKQVVKIDKNHYVDQRCCFGNSASFAIFASVNSLIAWIAKKDRGITAHITYVDDSSGPAMTGDVTFYELYGRFYPSPQTALLKLWDELQIPHKAKKQIYGPSLPIIGIVVDPNALTYTLPDASRERLVNKLESWISPRSTCFRLRRWQRLGGWINWNNMRTTIPHNSLLGNSSGQDI